MCHARCVNHRLIDLFDGKEDEGMNHTKHWEKFEETLIDATGWHSSECEPGLRMAVSYAENTKERWVKEYKEEKMVINRIWWVSIPLFIYFLYGMVAGSKEDAYDFLDTASWVYAFIAALAIGEKIYKWAKLTFAKKQNMPKQQGEEQD